MHVIGKPHAPLFLEKYKMYIWEILLFSQKDSYYGTSVVYGLTSASFSQVRLLWKLDSKYVYEIWTSLWNNPKK